MFLRAEISSHLEQKDIIWDPHDEVTIWHRIHSPFLLLCMPRCRLPVESPGISSPQINLGTPSIMSGFCMISDPWSRVWQCFAFHSLRAFFPLIVMIASWITFKNVANCGSEVLTSPWHQINLVSFMATLHLSIKPLLTVKGKVGAGKA